MWPKRIRRLPSRECLPQIPRPDIDEIPNDVGVVANHPQERERRLTRSDMAADFPVGPVGVRIGHNT